MHREYTLLMHNPAMPLPRGSSDFWMAANSHIRETRRNPVYAGAWRLTVGVDASGRSSRRGARGQGASNGRGAANALLRRVIVAATLEESALPGPHRFRQITERYRSSL